MEVPIRIHAETEAAVRSPTRKRVPGRTQKYVEESDAATTKVYT
jgi:hypothetical protein